MTELLIVGTGAMALLFGSRFAAAGLRPAFLGTWQAGLAALREAGIRVSVMGAEECYPVQVYQDPDRVPACDLALVLVKSWQTSRAADQLRRILPADGLAITLQNGLGNLEILAEALGEERAAQGVTTYGATLLEPGLVRPGGEGVISLPEHPRLAAALELFQQAGLAVQQVADLTSLIWGKLAINVAINPLSALLGVPNGKLLESAPAREVMKAAASEAARVAEAMGIELNFKDPAQAAEAVAQATAQNRSSMLQDLSRGAPTEIDMLCGAVTRLGTAHGIPTPTNQVLAALIKARVDLQG